MYCQAEMKKSTVPFHIDRKGVHVSLDEIPAWVCPQCGESYLEEEEVDSVQALVKAVEDQAQRFAKSA
jgi:YgiT-type zinc finger domain-containing protein